MTSVSLRRARPADADAAAALLRASIAGLCTEDHGGDPDAIARWCANKTAANVAAWIAAAPDLFWVADDGSGLAGVAAAAPEGKVQLLYVAPQARFRGISTALLRRVEAGLAALGLPEARLETTRTARTFYAARGWVATGADTMRKDLPAVRRLAPYEADLWRTIRLNALASEPAAFAERHDDWADRPLSDFAARLTGSAVFLAEFAGAAVGCAELTPDDDGTPGRAWVESVFVSRLSRGRGVADALLAAIEAEARRQGVTELCLDVSARNAAARGAYARAGYAEMAERPSGSQSACEITMHRALG
ncbi:MAG: GNAT family N-acetyltransferase [Rhodobacteraceae bacterium]|nr:GNAT family N-acetyltransferase [Paracoccaceae bacterium]